MMSQPMIPDQAQCKQSYEDYYYDPESLTCVAPGDDDSTADDDDSTADDDDSTTVGDDDTSG
jgi:hypothetical protein